MADAVITMAIALWIAGTWRSRRKARVAQAWLRSDVPAKLAYARLRAELERRRDVGGA